jgi:shikimate kinase
LVKRLNKDTQRPLLAGGNVRDKIVRLMEQRKDIYEQVADKIIDTDGKDIKHIYEEITGDKWTKY